jgi:hypothetical protein
VVLSLIIIMMRLRNTGLTGEFHNKMMCDLCPQTSHNIDCFLDYTDRVPFELLDSAALLYEGRAAVEGGQIVFLNLTTII